ncbi:MAG TPA: twin-arginine translocase TatA/TatE family subunit [Kofleriaceae bacterium]|nr:twin-arginine translocase TatA/TatE family subunit [Kofleriaceae bacterium]
MGGTEILVILIVALLFLGPDKLPEAAKTISKGIRDIKKQSRVLQRTIEDDEHIGGAIRDLRSALRGEEEPFRPSKPKELDAPTTEVVAAEPGSPQPDPLLGPGDPQPDPGDSAEGGHMPNSMRAAAETTGGDASIVATTSADPFSAGAPGTSDSDVYGARSSPSAGSTSGASTSGASISGASTSGSSPAGSTGSASASGASTSSASASGASTSTGSSPTGSTGSRSASGASASGASTSSASASGASRGAGSAATAASAAPALTFPPTAGQPDEDAPPPSAAEDAALASLVKPAPNTIAHTPRSVTEPPKSPGRKHG